MREPKVVIIGAGMSGICMAAMLTRAGIEDVTVLEKAGDVGGTWRDNHYPGLECDVPSAFYQFTFDRNPTWTRFFSPGPEIHRYFAGTVDRLGLRNKIRFNTEVVRSEFHNGQWQVDTASGDRYQADFLLSATGVLHHPVLPDIPGLDDFAGPRFHTARWDDSVDLKDKRVAVIGTGSTGAQLTVALGGKIKQLDLYQRTPQWVIPLPNWGTDPLTKVLRRFLPLTSAMEYHLVKRGMAFLAEGLTRPGWRRKMWSVTARGNLRTVRDPELRAKLTPDYQPGCKRLVISGKFYRAVQRPGVTVITEGIDHIEPRGIVTKDGVLHETDVLVLATGFDARAYLRPIQLIGPGGLTLDQAWKDGARAYRTVALPGFPNFFMLMGPHSPVGNYSLTAIAEAQAKFALNWIQDWRRGAFSTATPSDHATLLFNKKVQGALPRTVWASGCNSWYLGTNGLPELWPWSPFAHERMLADNHRDEFVLDA
ncbi:NAD(P)/FAD-dependent oxidoreductase [Pseudonocardiaceae bacterium YIM PH 21723]|nr:NAD(P)/FAD-dependent oxidoreductase [Pseudonocardiaceae bacterium YIM PH 21723]